MAAFEDDILNWGLARGDHITIHENCGLRLSDANPNWPTEAFRWESKPFHAWSYICGTTTKKYATKYTISSSPDGVANAFDFIGLGTNQAQLVTTPYELLPCRFWASHPQGILYPLDFNEGIEYDKPLIPSQEKYVRKPNWMDFECTITAYFPGCCPATLTSHSFTLRVVTNWSSRASDLMRGLGSHPHPKSGEDAGLGTTWFHPNTQEPMTADEWHQWVCENLNNASRFLANTKHNMHNNI